jgi:hypothetical protein
LEDELNRQLNLIAKENIWSEEDWDLLTRKFLEYSESTILSMPHLHRLLNELREGTEINSFWKSDRPSADTVIRRYRPLNRFQSILENSALWFSRTDVFEDQFEGSFAYANIERGERVNKQRRDRLAKDEVIAQEQARRFQREHTENTNKRTYINCWRQGTDEPAILWDAYIGDKLGVAIEATIRDFRKAISKEISDCHRETIRARKEARRKYMEATPENRDKRERIEDLVLAVMTVEYSKMQIGSVRYVDFDNDVIPRSRYARFFTRELDLRKKRNLERCLSSLWRNSTHQ